MERLSWVVQVDLTCSHVYTYNEEAEGTFTQTRCCEDGAKTELKMPAR